MKKPPVFLHFWVQIWTFPTLTWEMSAQHVNSRQQVQKRTSMQWGSLASRSSNKSSAASKLRRWYCAVAAWMTIQSLLGNTFCRVCTEASFQCQKCTKKSNSEHSQHFCIPLFQYRNHNLSDNKTFHSPNWSREYIARFVLLRSIRVLLIRLSKKPVACNNFLMGRLITIYLFFGTAFQQRRESFLSAGSVSLSLHVRNLILMGLLAAFQAPPHSHGIPGTG